LTFALPPLPPLPPVPLLTEIAWAGEGTAANAVPGQAAMIRLNDAIPTRAVRRMCIARFLSAETSRAEVNRGLLATFVHVSNAFAVAEHFERTGLSVSWDERQPENPRRCLRRCRFPLAAPPPKNQVTSWSANWITVSRTMKCAQRSGSRASRVLGLGRTCPVEDAVVAVAKAP
jgi:hypothetical protein